MDSKKYMITDDIVAKYDINKEDITELAFHITTDDILYSVEHGRIEGYGDNPKEAIDRIHVVLSKATTQDVIDELVNEMVKDQDISDLSDEYIRIRQDAINIGKKERDTYIEQLDDNSIAEVPPNRKEALYGDTVGEFIDAIDKIYPYDNESEDDRNIRLNQLVHEIRHNIEFQYIHTDIHNVIGCTVIDTEGPIGILKTEGSNNE